MDAQIEKLKRWGVDWQETMDRFMNDEDLYLICVNKYLADPGFAGLGDAINKQDFKTAFEQAHTLKGVTANLGLTPIFNVVCNIVEPLRNGDYSNLNELYAKIIEKKEELAKVIE